MSNSMSPIFFVI